MIFFTTSLEVVALTKPNFSVHFCYRNLRCSNLVDRSKAIEMTGFLKLIRYVGACLAP